MNITPTSNTLLNNDSSKIIAFAEQLQDREIDWTANKKYNGERNNPEYDPEHPDPSVPETLPIIPADLLPKNDASKLQSKLNEFFLNHWADWQLFLYNKGLDPQTIDSWYEVEQFLKDIDDDEAAWLMNRLTELQTQINGIDQGGVGILDVSATNNSGGTYAEYESLSDVIVNVDNPPIIHEHRKSGMTIRFINNSTKKYEQWRYLEKYADTTAGNTAFANVDNWTRGGVFATGESVDRVGIDAEPTAGSGNLVKSGGVYGAFKDVSENMVLFSIFSGSVNNNYSWYNGQVYIPAGTTVKNASQIKVNLYPVKDSSYDSQRQTVDAGEIVIAERDFYYIKGTAVGGDFKLIVSTDTALADIQNLQSSLTEVSGSVSTLQDNVGTIQGDVSTLQTDMTAAQGNVTALQTKTNSIDSDLTKKGILELEVGNITAWKNKTLPVTIPFGTEISIYSTTETIPSDLIIYANYGEQDQTTILNSGIIPVTAPVNMTNIRPNKTVANVIIRIKPSFAVPDIQDNSIAAVKIKGELVKSTNLYDKNDPDCISGYYMSYASGTLVSNNSLKVSGWIPVSASTYYIANEDRQVCFFDSNKLFISGVQHGNVAFLTPSNTAYVRVSPSNNDSSFYLNEGQTLKGYEEFYEKKRTSDIIVDSDNIDISNNPEIVMLNHRFANGYLNTDAVSLGNNETLSLDDYPKSLKQGDVLVMEANVASWGDGIVIGKGTTGYSATYLEVSSSQIIQKVYYAADDIRTVNTVSHGLTFESFVKAVITISADKWDVILQTLEGQYVGSLNCSTNNGTPRVTSIGASLTNVYLAATNKYFSSPIWAFGDSYFGTSSSNREMYWLKEWGYLNFLLQGYAGQSSAGAYPDLQKCLAIGVPKYLIWCLGMNDNVSLENWQSYIASIRTFCDNNGVTLILGTIPQPADTVNYKYKDDMSDWIREESGCRYIDIAKAVGSDENGHWYGYGETYDYQSSDDVHPTQYGARAIASQFIIDVPEISQYK